MSSVLEGIGIRPAGRYVSASAGDTFTKMRPKALYVGGGGDVVLRPKSGGTTATFAGVAAGTFMPVTFYEIVSSGTTATDMVALFEE